MKRPEMTPYYTKVKMKPNQFLGPCSGCHRRQRGVLPEAPVWKEWKKTKLNQCCYGYYSS